MDRFDAVVIGAGPAGATAALRLARARAAVLLVDRARFPRDKPCGGGVTVRALRELPVGIESVVEATIDRFTIRLGYARSFERRSTAPLCLMTQRSRLDAHLVSQAVAAGAEFADGARVSDIRLDADAVRMRVGGATVRAKTLVAADGVNGTTTRAAGLGGGLGHAVALEGNVGHEHVPRSLRAGVTVELGVVPGGYGWIFPKQDHVNVGVGGWASEAPMLREHLARLCRENGLDVARVETLRGYRLPFRTRATVLARGRALAVGDAAGLVDPLSGDGIYEAAVSGRLAAEAILADRAGSASALSTYPARIARELGALASGSWAAKHALERFPRATFTVVRSRLVWPAVEQLLRGEQTGRSRVPLAAMRMLARFGFGGGRANGAGDAESTRRVEAAVRGRA